MPAPFIAACFLEFRTAFEQFNKLLQAYKLITERFSDCGFTCFIASEAEDEALLKRANETYAKWLRIATYLAPAECFIIANLDLIKTDSDLKEFISSDEYLNTVYNAIKKAKIEDITVDDINDFLTYLVTKTPLGIFKAILDLITKNPLILLNELASRLVDNVILNANDERAALNNFFKIFKPDEVPEHIPLVCYEILTKINPFLPFLNAQILSHIKLYYAYKSYRQEQKKAYPTLQLLQYLKYSVYLNDELFKEGYQYKNIIQVRIPLENIKVDIPNKIVLNYAGIKREAIIRYLHDLSFKVIGKSTFTTRMPITFYPGTSNLILVLDLLQFHVYTFPDFKYVTTYRVSKTPRGCITGMTFPLFPAPQNYCVSAGGFNPNKTVCGFYFSHPITGASFFYLYRFQTLEYISHIRDDQMRRDNTCGFNNDGTLVMLSVQGDIYKYKTRKTENWEIVGKVSLQTASNEDYITVSPNGKYVMTVSNHSGNIRFFKFPELTLIKEYPAYGRPVINHYWSPDNRYAFVCHLGYNEIRAYKAPDFSTYRCIKPPENCSIRFITFPPDKARYLLHFYDNNTKEAVFQYLDLKTFEVISEYRTKDLPALNTIDFNDRGNYAVGLGSDGYLYAIE